MRILFIHEVNYLSKPIFEMHEIPEGLAQRGHEVIFVDFPEGEAWPRSGRVRSGTRVSGRVLPEQRIKLLRFLNGPGGMVGRILTALTFRQWFRRVLSKYSPDVVVTYSVPTSGWQAVQECSRAGIPIVYRALDVSHLIRRSSFRPLIRRKEHEIIRHADWVSANNPELAKYCRAIRGCRQSVSVEKPPLDIDHFQARKEKHLDTRRSMGIPQTATVYLYMGSFFYFSGLEDVLESFAKHSQRHEYLVLIGGGETESALRELASKLQVRNRIIFAGMIPYVSLPEHLRIADVALNPMQVSLVSNAAIPNKILQYLSCELPVVTTRLLGLTSSGLESELLFEVATPKDVFLKAKHVASKSETKMPTLSKNTASLEEYRREIALSKFEKLLYKVRGGPR